MDEYGLAVQAKHPSVMTGRSRAMLASTIGSMMEWYDFVTFGYLSVYLAGNFYPSGNETVSLLSAFATFGVGFLARPVGGYIFGAYGDKYGRKAALMLTMILMAIATLAIGLLPSFRTIGIFAPLCLVGARLLQGMSAGGESTTGMVYAVEWAPAGQRGFYGGIQMAGSGSGLLLGSIVVTGLVMNLSAAQISDWGWRVPFVLGFFIGPIGVWIRTAIEESPVYAAIDRAERPRTTFAIPWKGILTIILIDMPWAIAYYVFLSYMPTYAVKYLHVKSTVAFSVNTISLVVYILAIPVFGRLSDRYGRRPILILCNLGFALLAYPLFLILANTASLAAYTAILFFFSVLLSMYSGPAVALFAEQFPSKSRNMWCSFSYGIAVALFGGFTPFVATWLIERLSNPLAPTFYITGTAAIGAVVAYLLRETAFDKLE